MKTGVEGRVSVFQQDVDKFSSRWEALRPKESDLSDRGAALKAIATIKERREELNALIDQAETLKRECSHFEVRSCMWCDSMFSYTFLPRPALERFPPFISLQEQNPASTKKRKHGFPSPHSL